MLRGKQVVVLIKKARYLNILDDFMQKEKHYIKIPAAKKIFKMFFSGIYDINFFILFNKNSENFTMKESW
jgi:hypothetical protein